MGILMRQASLQVKEQLEFLTVENIRRSCYYIGLDRIYIQLGGKSGAGNI
jgi:hypothetical protein